MNTSIEMRYINSLPLPRSFGLNVSLSVLRILPHFKRISSFSNIQSIIFILKVIATMYLALFYSKVCFRRVLQYKMHGKRT